MGAKGPAGTAERAGKHQRLRGTGFPRLEAVVLLLSCLGVAGEAAADAVVFASRPVTPVIPPGSAPPVECDLQLEYMLDAFEDERDDGKPSVSVSFRLFGVRLLSVDTGLRFEACPGAENPLLLATFEGVRALRIAASCSETVYHLDGVTSAASTYPVYDTGQFRTYVAEERLFYEVACEFIGPASEGASAGQTNTFGELVLFDPLPFNTQAGSGVSVSQLSDGVFFHDVSSPGNTRLQYPANEVEIEGWHVCATGTLRTTALYGNAIDVCVDEPLNCSDGEIQLLERDRAGEWGRPQPTTAGSGSLCGTLSWDDSFAPAVREFALVTLPPPLDSDGDGVPDEIDNCPLILNTDQVDTDSDGQGDVCDLCPTRANFEPSEEVCGGGDDDCDGRSDEGLGTRTCGLGACANAVPLCVDGMEQDCQPLPAAEERCGNERDDDCDGLSDEGCVDCFEESLGQVCTSRMSGQCAAGTLQCPQGQWGQASCVAVQSPTAEECDAEDDDCDGATDEGFGSARCGRGRCNHEQQLCVNGSSRVCDPLQGAADQEGCDDGEDDDCDGLIDEDCAECVQDTDCDDGNPCTFDICTDAGTCTSEARCEAPAICEEGECLPRGLPLGARCGAEVECATGRCVDGVCCDSMCTGLCLACVAELTQADDGTCAPVAEGTDPDDECIDEGEASCGLDGSCDGEGACRHYRAGTVCSSDLCLMPDVADTPDECDGQGHCVEKGEVPCEPGYACVRFACKDSCASDIDCIASYHCVDSQCQPDLPTGSPCTQAGHCQSNHCVDGVCCDTACGGTCRSCLTASKGYGADGFCEAVALGLDGESECEADGLVCGALGVCNGEGACLRKAAETVRCGPTTCADGVVSGQLCDGRGGCASGTAPCGLYGCGGQECASVCEADEDCSNGFCASGGACVALLALGTSCVDNSHCASGHCVDGFCCENACEGQCEACDLPDGRGRCRAIQGTPHGSRTPCAADEAICAGQCNGAARDQCAYPAASTVCGEVSCDDGEERLAACDGAGACRQMHQSCGNYRCDGDRCLERCDDSSDCAAEASCVDQTCRRSGQERACTSDASWRSEDEEGDCFPYRCADGGCLQACESDDDCALGRVCESGTCARPDLEPGGERGGDCGCSTPGRRGSTERGGWLAWALSLVFAFACSRRWRRRATVGRCAADEHQPPIGQ